MTSPNQAANNILHVADIVNSPYETHHWLTDTTSHVVPALKLISFHHPGYPHLLRPLLILPPLDRSQDQSDPRWGIHYGTAITACSIIACNRAGYLTEASPDGPRVDASWDSLLTSPTYYFHVESLGPGDETQNTFIRYPVCPTFYDREFPETMPQEWVSYELHTKTASNGNPLDSIWILLRTIRGIPPPFQTRTPPLSHATAIAG